MYTATRVTDMCVSRVNRPVQQTPVDDLQPKKSVVKENKITRIRINTRVALKNAHITQSRDNSGLISSSISPHSNSSPQCGQSKSPDTPSSNSTSKLQCGHWMTTIDVLPRISLNKIIAGYSHLYSHKGTDSNGHPEFYWLGWTIEVNKWFTYVHEGLC